ncbi:MAG: serine/threonine protein phosphatase [Sphingomonadales bacterium]|nr:serine/threonine protein phosphatase [Sphingomonadales bacterium]MBD3773695.1 serine/threonine protein phosphatase [Paracoccaceae bacterium]
MFKPFRQLFRKSPPGPNASIPPGERYYVIGDIHGRLDLFDELIHAIEEDDLEAPDAQTTVVLLGDLVDRGPDSRGVIARAREWQAQRKVRVLAGNHEDMFLLSFDDTEVLRHFLKHGGRETILSYGLDRETYNRATLEEVQQMMAEVVPTSDQDFIRSFEECVVAGDYLFVHAGIDPEAPLEQQKRHDMLWIREPFLRHADPLSHVVVHGHTIVDEVDERPNRIGIDTGAFRSDRLTALVLEGTRRRYIQTAACDGQITVERREKLA